jgi:hypothetical protein
MHRSLSKTGKRSEAAFRIHYKDNLLAGLSAMTAANLTRVTRDNSNSLPVDNPTSPAMEAEAEREEKAQQPRSRSPRLTSEIRPEDPK